MSKIIPFTPVTNPADATYSDGKSWYAHHARLERVLRRGREAARYAVWFNDKDDAGNMACIGVVASGHLNGHSGKTFWRASNSGTALRTRKLAVEALVEDYLAADEWNTDLYPSHYAAVVA